MTFRLFTFSRGVQRLNCDRTNLETLNCISQSWNSTRPSRMNDNIQLSMTLFVTKSIVTANLFEAGRIGIVWHSKVSRDMRGCALCTSQLNTWQRALRLSIRHGVWFLLLISAVFNFTHGRKYFFRTVDMTRRLSFIGFHSVCSQQTRTAVTASDLIRLTPGSDQLDVFNGHFPGVFLNF